MVRSHLQYARFVLAFAVTLIFSYHELFAQTAPASCTASIGTPASGASHYINISWSPASGATGYELQDSTPGAGWADIYAGSATAYAHNTGSIGNLPFFYRVSSGNGSSNSAWTYCTQFPIYNACNDTTPVLSNATYNSITANLQTSGIDSNANNATYAIYCLSTAQYVQANGALGASAVYQTASAWGTIVITGLSVSTDYCFYTIAKNHDGNVQTASGGSLSTPQTFNTSNTLSTSQIGVKWYSPGTCTGSSEITWHSTGGCSGGTGGGCVGYTTSPGEFDGCFLASPEFNATGQSQVTLTFDLNSSASTLGDYIYFYLWSNEANNDFSGIVSSINGANVSTILLDSANNCTTETVVIDLSSVPDADRGSILLYLNPMFYEEAGTPFNVLFDNIAVGGGYASACLSTTACTDPGITGNPSTETVCAGSSTSFSVTTSGSVGTYQWQQSATGTTWTNLTNTAPYSGVNTAMLTITDVTTDLNGYQYRCSVTGSCSGSAISTAGTLNVSGSSVVAGDITGTATVCEGQDGVTYSITTVAGATSYTWSLPTGATIESGSGTSSISVNYASTATSGNVIVTPVGTCGNGTASPPFAVTVNTIPVTPGSIDGPAAPCASATATYSVIPVTGATFYNWTLPGGWSGSSNSSNITATPGSSGTITVSASNTCGTSTAQSLSVTVGQAPATPGSISGSTSVCGSGNIIYSVTAVSGANSYNWTLPNGWSGSSTSNSITATPGNAGGNITVSATNTCGTSAVQSLSVTVGQSPVTPGSISGPASVCGSGNVTYSVPAVSGATSYNWTLPGGWSGSSTSASITLTPGNTGGNITVSATNTCGTSAAQSLSVTVGQGPSTPGSISGPASVCGPGSVTYSVSAINGATSYNWTLPGGWSGSSTSNSITVTPGNSGGNITVSATNNCGTSGVQTLAVIIGGGPPAPGAIMGLTVLCGTGTTTYAVNSVSGATSYTWTLPNGWTGGSTADSIIVTPDNSGGTISVSASNTCGTSAVQTLAVSIGSVPDEPGAISGPTVVCGSGTIVYNVVAVENASFYTWTLPSGWTGTSASNSISVTPGPDGGSILVSAANSCGNSTAQVLAITTTQAPPAPTNVIGPGTVCGGEVIYGVLPVSGATSYSWTLPGGWTGSSTTDSITVTPGTTGGVISVSANSSCGTSQAVSETVVSLRTPATPVAIIAPAPVCSNLPEIFSVNPVTYAGSYIWTLPDGWTGSSTTDSITAFTSNSGGTITVAVKNSCGTSSAQTLVVDALDSLPGEPDSISGPLVLCQLIPATYSVPAVNGASFYTWTLPDSWTGNSTNDSITTITGSGTGSISVAAGNGCGNSAAQTITVTGNPLPAAAGIITGSDSVCSGTPVLYSVSPIANASTYVWTLPSDWITNGTDSSYSIFESVGNSGGQVSVFGKNACGSGPVSSLSVAVAPHPVVTITDFSVQLCADTSFVILNNGTPAGGVYSGLGVSNDTFYVASLGTGNYLIVYTYTSVYGCGGSDTATATIQRCTDIENIYGAGVAVFPNPFSDYIKLKMQAITTESSVMITDETGRVVLNTQIPAFSNDFNINTGALEEGVYILRILSKDGQQTAVRKLLKVE
jgi:hypothetical protein